MHETHASISCVDFETYLNSTVRDMYKMDVVDEVDPNPIIDL